MQVKAEQFLRQCCILIDDGKVDPFTQNPKTKSTLNTLGYNVKVMLQEIKELKFQNYHGGPYHDRDSKYPGDVWIFKKIINSYSIYIKLKIRVTSKEELFVMSFHIDD